VPQDQFQQGRTQLHHVQALIPAISSFSELLGGDDDECVDLGHDSGGIDDVCA
jgi:hypothetical protein